MWTCSGCSEEIEDGFDACWQCGTLKGGAPAHVHGSDPEPIPWEALAQEGPESTEEYIPSHLVAAILTTCCCCLPFGVVAIAYAAQVGPKLASGDREGAKSASESAITWVWAAVASAVLIFVLAFIAELSKPGPPSWNPQSQPWPN